MDDTIQSNSKGQLPITCLLATSIVFWEQCKMASAAGTFVVIADKNGEGSYMKSMNPLVKTYFDGFAPEVQERLHQIRNLVFSLVPDAEEDIKYGIPTFIYHGNLMHYAAFKHHIGFYPVPSGMEAFKEELKSYKQGKGSVQFPLTQPLPLELIERIARFRIAESLYKA
jgi:uncharacterized protein YdhG (YjbR/CyaY superfamily)